jgi:malonate decarboxylase beta subunit
MSSYSDLSANERAAALADRGSFVPIGGKTRGTLMTGRGTIEGVPVLFALTDGHVQGGTIGVEEAGILVGLMEQAQPAQASSAASTACGPPPQALIVGFDTGGVRVQEGPRALAAASAAGVALARLSLLGMPIAAVISGPRGCFGAPAVMAALPDRIIMIEGTHWGLTGPRLFSDPRSGNDSQAGFAATSAATRLANGDANSIVTDEPEAIRAALSEFLIGIHGKARPSIEHRLAGTAETLADLRRRWLAAHGGERPVPPSVPRRRRRDLLRYSFRGQWRPDGPMRREGLVHAALGTLAERPALGLIVGPEGAQGTGVGIEEAAVVTEMIRLATAPAASERATILSFLFCQGHAVDLTQERYGLPRALAECLRAMVGARLLGHPIVSVLGGGTYGAAYLSLAAPSHRILALRGTSVAPMAPDVLRAFQALRGAKAMNEAQEQLADLIPDIRIVESIIRLPRVLREELFELLARVRPEVDAA